MSESVGVVDRQDHAAALAELIAGIDKLLALDVSAQGSAELCSSLPEISAQIGRLQHHLGTRAAELNARSVPAELGFRGTSQFLQAILRCTSRTARELALAVERFGPRTSLTGQQLEPHFPVAAEALTTGVISSKHAKAVADAICDLPEPARLRHWSEVETVLVELARTKDPASVTLLARRIAAHLDPDGPEPNDETDRRAASRRRLFLNRMADSSGELGAVLTPACQAIWEAVLTPLAAKPVTDALGEDHRTDAQRWHDAFEQAGKLLLSSRKLPDNAGIATTLIVNVDLTDLERRIGRATTHHGGTLSIREALRIATAGAIVPVVLGDGGEVLDYGRGRRLASPGQRRALFARDRGCTFPDCTRPAARSEIHHVTEWTHGGQTNLSTMAIACGYHNNEAPRQGWKTLMIKGIPHWQPPNWRDPARRPLRNFMHHPELLKIPGIDSDPPAGEQGRDGEQGPEGELRDSELRDSELRDNELRDSELRDSELRDNELRDNELWDNELWDNELWDNELWDNELRDNELRDNELRDNELRDSELRDSELRDNELRDNELRDNELRDNELRDNELRDNELRDNELRDSELVISQGPADDP